MLVGISGKIGSGKDALAGILQVEALSYNEYYSIKKYATKLKQIASILTGIEVKTWENREFKDQTLGHEWDEKSLSLLSDTVNVVPMTSRRFMQLLGTECTRLPLHPDVWDNALFADYRQGDNWIISDVRFPSNATYVKERGGMIVRINRKHNPYTASTHVSEMGLDSYEHDYTFNNDGTLEDLKKEAQLFYQAYMRKKLA